MLGIGLNGHIGINQPGTPFESETWMSPMDPDFEARVRRETNIPASVVQLHPFCEVLVDAETGKYLL